MLEYIKRMLNRTETENGASTLQTTGKECVDLFATIGALRKASEIEIISRFERAFAVNPDIAVKILFYARDIREGLGERRVFRIIMEWLAVMEPEIVKKNIEYIAEFGRYDDLLILMNTSCEKEMLTYLKNQYEKDCLAMKQGETISLLAKWLPSVNASNKETVKNAKKIVKAWGIREVDYRKSVSALRNYIKIIENNLRERNYSFDYEKQPSRALYKYRGAFVRNDGNRYTKFLEEAEKGKAKLKADNIAPYELVEQYLTAGWYGDYSNSFMRSITADEKRMLNATWKALPDFGGEENALAVIDTSASMYWQHNPMPAAVALSLGIYFAERNKGHFRNCFIEFSDKPQLIEVKGKTFADRLRYAASFNNVANTSLEAVFDLILQTAVKYKLPQGQLPAKLIVISDMEFDRCVSDASATNFENARRKFERRNYQLPEIVFWNVASRNRQQPVKENEQGVCLVSGVTPRLFSMVAGENLSPYILMMETISKERYRKIVA